MDIKINKVIEIETLVWSLFDVICVDFDMFLIYYVLVG